MAIRRQRSWIGYRQWAPLPSRARLSLLDQKGDKHAIRASGSMTLRTLNIYVAPAYKRTTRRWPQANSANNQETGKIRLPF